jgi:hypothetical protein
MAYVIQRHDGRFVARQGERHSYTKYLQHARPFGTREAAEAERCPGNETVVHVDAVIYRQGGN